MATITRSGKATNAVPSLLKRWQKTRQQMLNSRLELSRLENSLAEHFDINRPVSLGGISGSYADLILDVDGPDDDEEDEDEWLDVALTAAGV